MRLQNTIQLRVFTRQYKCTKQVVNSEEMDADEVIDNWSDIESAVSSDESDEREESEDSQESTEESEDSVTDDEDTPDSWTEVTGNVHINTFCMHYLFTYTALHIVAAKPRQACIVAAKPRQACMGPAGLCSYFVGSYPKGSYMPYTILY